MRRGLLSFIFIFVVNAAPIWGQPDQDKAVKQRSIVDWVFSGEKPEVKTTEHPEHLSENYYYKLLRVESTIVTTYERRMHLTILYQAKKDFDIGVQLRSANKLIVDCFDKEGRPIEGTSMELEPHLSEGEIRKATETSLPYGTALPHGTATFKLHWHSLK